MFCGNCGTELREGARFCPGCGAPVEDQKADTHGDRGGARGRTGARTRAGTRARARRDA